MGQDQKRRANYDDDDEKEEYEEKEKEEDEGEEEDDDYNEIIINNDTQNNSSSCQKIKEELDQMKLSIDEVKEKFDYYKNNYDKLLKINKIITNIKYANLYESSPQNILFIIVPVSEITKDNPNYGPLEKKTMELLKEYSIIPEYILPAKWEELFKLESTDTAIDKLFIQSEIERIKKDYSEINFRNIESLQNEINQNNYKDYDEKIKENIDKNIKLIIQNVKDLNIYNLTPNELIIKFYPENSKYSYPKQWKNLFKLQDKSKIDYLLGVTEYLKREKKKMEREKEEERLREIERQIEEKKAEEERIEKEKKEMMKQKKDIGDKYDKLKVLKKYIDYKNIKKNYQYYINNYETFKKINNILGLGKELQEYNIHPVGPKTVFKNVFKYDGCDLKNWKDLVKLDYDKDILDKLLLAVKLSLATRKISVHLSNIDNKFRYMNKGDKKDCKDLQEKYKEFKELNLEPEEKFKALEEYEKKFNRYAIRAKNAHIDGILELNEKIRRRREEKGLDPNFQVLYKVGINLCNGCKGACVGCGKALSPGKRVTRSLGLHKKCYRNSCFICGKSTTVGDKRGDVYLCFNCNDSKKYPNNKCICCISSWDILILL